jgi:hypothetical protein
MGNVQMDMTLPRSSCLNVSAMLPDPTVRGHDPDTPAKKRQMIKDVKLVDRAQPTVNIKNKKVLT